MSCMVGNLGAARMKALEVRILLAASPAHSKAGYRLPEELSTWITPPGSSDLRNYGEGSQ